MAANHLPRVEAMRGVAALAVFVFHGFAWIHGFSTLEQAEGARRFGLTLDVGVTIFFVISGFLLFRPFALALWEGRSLPDTRAYAWRRFLRIVPAYWVALTLLAFFSQRPDPLQGGPVPYYSFAQIYSQEWARWGIGQAWTLCIEVTFYVMLPVLAWVLVRLAGGEIARRRRALVIALLGLVAITTAWKYGVLASVEGRRRVLFEQWLPWHLDVFAAGMALSVLTLRPDSRAFALARSAGTWFTRGGLALALGALLLAAYVTTPGGHDGWDMVARQFLYTVCAAAVMAVAVLTPGGGRIDRVLLWRPLVFAGTISYSIYLFHLTIITRVFERVDSTYGRGVAYDLLEFGVALAATIAVATVSYYIVERPAMNLRRLVPDRRRALAQADRSLPDPHEALAPPDRVVPDPHDALPARQPT